MLRGTCEYIVSGSFDYAHLEPHLGTLLASVGKSFGDTKCANELLGAVRDSGFTIDNFCTSVSYACVVETVSGLQQFPFAGGFIPSGTAPLIADVCSFYGAKMRNTTLLLSDRIESHLPTLLSFFGMFFETASARASETCAAESAVAFRDPIDKSGARSGIVSAFDPVGMCKISPTCRNETFFGMQTLPVVGSFFSNSIVGMMMSACSALQSSHSKSLVLTDVDDAYQWSIYVLGFIDAVIENAGLTESCTAQLQQAGRFVRGDAHAKLLCSSVDETCLAEAFDTLQQTELFASFFTPIQPKF